MKHSLYTGFFGSSILSIKVVPGKIRIFYILTYHAGSNIFDFSTIGEIDHLFLISSPHMSINISPVF